MDLERGDWPWVGSVLVEDLSSRLERIIDTAIHGRTLDSPAREQQQSVLGDERACKGGQASVARVSSSSSSSGLAVEASSRQPQLYSNHSTKPCTDPSSFLTLAILLLLL